jgi:Bacterial TSP3 repeat
MNARILSIAAVFAFFSFNTFAATHYVDLNCTNPVPPYSDWSTAATNIQDAIDAATNGDLVLVTNGIYQTGGRPVNGYALTNRVVINKAVIVQSVNGPATCVIQGNPVISSNAIRCVYLTNNAILVGFTLNDGGTLFNPDIESENPYLFSGGGIFCEPGASVENCVITNCMASDNGGGVWCEADSAIVSNCVVTGCSTSYGGGVSGGTLLGCFLSGNTSYSGGGAYDSTLIDCMVISNSAGYGGGAIYSSLTHCTLSGNSAFDGSYGTGGGSYQCTLNDCISSNNVANYSAGGDYEGILANCVLVNNSAAYGGGAVFSTMDNCMVISNQASADAGGTYFSTLNDCTLVGNSCNGSGGGDNSSSLNDCIIYNNTAPSEANYSGSSLNYCCTIPLPTSGVGNITNEPLFVNLSGGDFHLQSNSPCINSGNNTYVTVTNDLDGNPRIKGGTVDIGAYEFQNPSSVLSYAWAQQYGLPTDGTADYADSDGDGMSNWQEWIAGTNPTNAASVLEMLTPASTNNSSGVTVSWQSVTNRNYFLDRSSDLSAQPVFSTIQSNLVGQAGTTSYTDTTATNSGPYFYRVGVQ